MVCEEDGGEAQLATAAGHIEWRNPAIKGSGAVNVEIDPDPGVSGHVRYYRSGEGSGKGSRKTGTSKGRHLAGKERLSSRKRPSAWN
jgi:hypothetical protein